MMHGYIEQLKNKPPFIKPLIFSDEPDIFAFLTTRHGGVSNNCYSTFNLSFSVNDNYENVFKNRQLLCNFIQVKPENIYSVSQEHSNKVLVIKGNIKDNNFLNPQSEIKGYDAIVTNNKGICLTIKIADCVPIILYEKEKKVISVIHSGWRGIFKNIIANTIQIMTDIFRIKPSKIVCFVGASAGPCCYEVNKEFYIKVNELFSNKDLLIQKKNDKYYFDMWAATKFQLINCGIVENNIEISKICTICNKEHFYSHRAFMGNTGRFMAGIFMKEN